jgi:hypothetical protein
VSASLAPVALFAFNRPQHLRRTIESLKECEGFSGTQVVLFCDGARNQGDSSAVQATRAIAHELLGDHAEYHLAPHNRGLAASIISGVELLLARHGRVIVIEDDLLLSPAFLKFQNDALDHYADDSRVYQVSGHMFDVPELVSRSEALLLPLTTTWGWGTWARAWRAFDPQAAGWEMLRRDRDLRRRFNFGGVYKYANMLERQMAGIRQSWGIRWYWSVFNLGGLTCFPPRSMVANIGMDGSGTHGRGALRGFTTTSLPNQWLSFTPPPGESVEPEAVEAVRKAVWRQNGGWIGAAVDQIRQLATRTVGNA